MKNKKLRNLLLTLLPLAAALLAASPSAVKLNFASPDEQVVEYFSAFSMTPVGYAVWGAFGGGIGSVALTALSILNNIRADRGIRRAMCVIAIVATVMMLSTALFGNMTAVGAVITVLLGLDAVLLYISR